MLPVVHAKLIWWEALYHLTHSTPTFCQTNHDKLSAASGLTAFGSTAFGLEAFSLAASDLAASGLAASFLTTGFFLFFCRHYGRFHGFAAACCVQHNVFRGGFNDSR